MGKYIKEKVDSLYLRSIDGTIVNRVDIFYCYHKGNGTLAKIKLKKVDYVNGREVKKWENQ